MAKSKNCVSKKEVKQMIKSENAKARELKFYNVDSSYSALLSYSGVVEDISAMARGDSDSNRDGDRCLPISLDLSYVIYGETYSSVYRMIVFRWLENTTPTVADILLSSGSGYSVTSGYQHDQRGLFNILYDKTHTVSNNGGSELVHVKRHLKMAKKQIDYSAGGTTGSNKIYVLGITDRSLATSATVAYISRLNFTDC